jgi:GNAT superfamily N-acetyltransferase
MNWYKKTQSEFPILGEPNIEKGEGSLSNTIKEPNDPYSSKMYGKEKLVEKNKNIEIYEGEYGSFRYLYKTDEGKIVGAIQGARIEDKNVLSAMYVDPKMRGQGIATTLLNLIKKQKENIILSNNFTEQGANFFGIKQ